MQYPSLRTIIFGLAVLTGTTSATVSLASFIPRIDNLPIQCSNVYNSRIEGCTAEDFNPTATCSSACVQGLVKITEAVNSGCSNVDVGETSIIGVFQNGLGIQALCPGVTVTTISSTSSSTTAPAQTSTQAVASTTSTTSTSETEDDEPSSTSSAGLLTDPGATGTFTTSTVNAPPTSAAQPGASSTDTNNSASPSGVANSQLSNADSGGGSPFDVVATGESSRLRVVDVSMATLLATALLFVACA
ncbi:Nn.00g001980.m01.CDS01 [Neocucurbitaria sp. VM-36]